MENHGWLWLALLISGCASEQKQVAERPGDSVEGCNAAGGRVVVDPGDGSGRCGPGEEVIGRPRGFIEGALCCRPVQPGNTPLSPR